MNKHSAEENTLSHYLNNECAALLTSLTSAKGLVCYEVDSDENPIKLHQHGLDSSFVTDLAFSKDSPLYPEKSVVREHQILSLQLRDDSEMPSIHSSYNHQLHSMGFSEVIDFKFRKNGALIAGISLFFKRNNSCNDQMEENKLQALHKFIENSINKIQKDSQNERLERFCNKNNLTNKEKQVFELSIKGFTNKAIASDLYCSVATVKTHLQHIFNKLSINRKAEAVTLFINSSH